MMAMMMVTRALIRYVFVFLLFPPNLYFFSESLQVEEIDALEDFFEATNELGWREECSSEWRFHPHSSHDPCEEQWYGVLCNNDNSSVTALQLVNCSLQGVFPPSFSLFASLHTLNISMNLVRGNLSAVSSLGKHNLRVLDLSHNRFSCTLPHEMLSLQEINLHNNSFYGPFLDSWAEMINLVVLNVSKNFLSGTIPSRIAAMRRLRSVDFSLNNLNGTIPVEMFDKLYDLEFASFKANYFSGSLPAELFYSRRLSDIDISHNRITSSLPNISDSHTMLAPLRHVYFNGNFISSTIPASFGLLDSIVILDLSYNFLEGVPSHGLFENNQSQLKYLYLQSNSFRGPIPSNIGNLDNVMHLFLFNNHFTGTIPPSVVKLGKLQTLLLQNNRLSGNPGTVLRRGHEALYELRVLDLSNNLFTGQVPSEIFELPKITYVSITEGCFHGSIPRTVCNANSLSHLILEGLPSGRDCSFHIWDPLKIFSQETFYTDGLTGGIPDCLFDLANLTTLHLSGNGIFGTIPPNSRPIGLKDLSLSYNKLTGSIPKSLLDGSYTRFDVSNNRISGTCHDMRQWIREDTNSESHLYLYSNRLSGDVPSNFAGLHFIDILDGNVFNCPQRSDLPRQDPDYTTYVCASDTYDEMLYIYGSLFGSCGILVLCLFLPNNYFSSFNRWTECLHRWSTRAFSVSSKESPDLHYFVKFLTLFRYFALNLMVLIVVVLGVTYALLKLVGDFGTHVYQYRWTLSVAYLSGTLASSVFIVGMIIVMGFFFYGITKVSSCVSKHAKSKMDYASTSSASTTSISIVNKLLDPDWRLKSSIMLLGLTANAVVVLLMNGIYIYLLMWFELSADIILSIQIVKAVFDIVWNNVAIRLFVRRIKATVQIKKAVRLTVAMLVFNTIIAPIFSTLVTDENCFVGLFVENHKITTSSSISYCAKLMKVNISEVPPQSPTCEVEGTLHLETSYTPNFLYNYQCSSSFLTNYIPVVIFATAIATFIVPVLRLCMSYVLTHKIPPDRFPLLPPAIYFPGVPLKRNPHHHVMSADLIMAKLLQKIALMVTFGVACPPLAFILGVHMFVMTWYHHILIGRYLVLKDQEVSKISHSENVIENPINEINDCKAFSSDQVEKSKSSSVAVANGVDILEGDCRGVTLALGESKWTIIDISCFCAALVLVDVSGDEVGFKDALLTATLPMVCLPIIMRLLCKVLFHCYSRKDRTLTSETMERFEYM